MKQFMYQNKTFSIILLVLSIVSGQALLNSFQSGEYGSALISALQIAIFAGALVTASRNSKKPMKGRRHTTLWGITMPQEATRAGLWMRAAFCGISVSIIFAGYVYISWLFDNGEYIVHLVVLSTQFLLWIPFFYWTFRKEYELASLNQADDTKLLLRYSDQLQKSSRLETLVVALGMGAVAVLLSRIGMWLS